MKMYCKHSVFCSHDFAELLMMTLSFHIHTATLHPQDRQMNSCFFLNSLLGTVSSLTLNSGECAPQKDKTKKTNSDHTSLFCLAVCLAVVFHCRLQIKVRTVWH